MGVCMYVVLTIGKEFKAQVKIPATIVYHMEEENLSCCAAYGVQPRGLCTYCSMSFCCILPMRIMHQKLYKTNKKKMPHTSGTMPSKHLPAAVVTCGRMNIYIFVTLKNTREKIHKDKKVCPMNERIILCLSIWET